MNYRTTMTFLNLALLLLLTTITGCNKEETTEGGKQSFLQIGEFTVIRNSPDFIEVRDGADRTLILIPRDAELPQGYTRHQIVRVPVKRVAAWSNFDVSALRSLGVLEEVLVGVIQPEDKWHIDEVKRGMKAGKIVYLGNSNAIDFEKLKKQQPELALTWDRSVIPMLNELEIPCIITSAPVAMCLNARMRYVQFLAPFFQREKEADAFFARVSDALKEIRELTSYALKKPKVMWGDIYEKRVLVEPGNAWVGELVELAQSNYLFEDVYGTSCIEISTERFLYSGEDADILFTYSSPSTGATSKAALARMNPILGRIRPLKEGRVYAPMAHYSQSGDKLDEILTEISAILHPELYPGYELRYFIELPDIDPVVSGEQS